MGNMLRRLSAVIAIALSASCMVSTGDETSSDESLGESAQALISCSVDCDCPLGNYCSSGTTCTDLDFGPHPEYTPCYGTCQCQSGEYCEFVPYSNYGQCVSAPKSCGPCSASKDCRCGPFCWPKSMACP
jgi:hypothetical protein